MKTTGSRTSILATAWAAVLVIALFKIVAQEIFHYTVSQNLQYSVAVGIAAAGLLLTLVWRDIRPLRPFFGLFLVLEGAQWLVYTRIDTLPFYRAWLDNPSFSVSMPAEQSLNLIVTLLIIAFLFVVKKRRQAFFLAKGDTAAPMAAIPWLGTKKGERWNKFGPIATVCITLGTLTFLVIGGRPSADMLVKVLPFLPAILLCAALNSFNEEMTYKASFLSVLEDVVGRPQALMLMAAFFGILHFYGVPYGMVGVLMAGVLGWLLGRSMVETRGLWWAWFIHFVQDVAIFFFLAVGSVTPGG
jgi:membrane protease YdiL (CAAX protease family)